MIVSLIIYNIYADHYLKDVTLRKKIVGIRLSKEDGTSDFKFVLAYFYIKVAVSVLWSLTRFLYLLPEKCLVKIAKTHVILESLIVK